MKEIWNVYVTAKSRKLLHEKYELFLNSVLHLYMKKNTFCSFLVPADRDIQHFTALSFRWVHLYTKNAAEMLSIVSTL
jgi:hypothetical protein